MSGVLSFLFDGKPPPSVTTYGSSTTNVPQWLSDYTQGLLGQANAVAAQPYQPYEGPRLAGLTPEQQQAFQLTQSNVGKGAAGIGSAMGTTQGILGTLDPNQIKANFASASKSFPQAASSYVNPYIDNVTKRAQELANRNFNENLLPELESKFTRSGQYGSQLMQDQAYKAARGVSEDLQSAADASLANAWNTAGTQFASDASRQGQLATSGITAGLQGSGVLGQLSDQLQKSNLTDAASLEAVGTTKQQQNQANLDLAQSDFQAQRDYPKEQVDWLSNIIHGIPNQGSTTTKTETGPATGKLQPSTIDQVGSLLALLKGLQSDQKG